MTPATVVHRYSIPTTEAIELLIGAAAADAEAWQIRIDGDKVIVDIVAPAEVTFKVGDYQYTVDQSGVVIPPATGKAQEAPSPSEAPTAQMEPQRAQAPAPAGKAPKSERKGGALAQRAGILCDQGAFHLWAEVKDAEAAAEFIRKHCGVASRADLDHDAAAGLKFRDLAASYQIWLDEA